MLRRREEEPLAGIFSKEWAFEPSLPTVCSQNPELHCGILTSPLSARLRGFLELPRKKSYLIKMAVTTQDEDDVSIARISVEAEGAGANFVVTTFKINGKGEDILGTIKHLRVERRFEDGRGEIEPFVETKKPYVKALREVIGLWDKKFDQVDQQLLCRACPAKKDGLPGSVVGDKSFLVD